MYDLCLKEVIIIRLDFDFYKQDALTVAKALLGKVLVRNLNGVEISGKIVETEAYIGPEDKGCHAYQSKRTKRTEAMFNNGGHAYVYLIYGMYYCFNVVTNVLEKPEAVLVRAVEPVAGIDIIKENRKIKSNKLENLTNGPGKLCKAMKIDKNFNNYNLIKGEDLFIRNYGSNQNLDIVTAKRINIDYAEEYKDKPWRFYLKKNSYVSKV
ncbi:DNA-3-methyladenine glycosylase [Desulfitispora alkaliphila]|uniref:DNA-3-methyladenine glycosylase n=1 Tax=Desulfitispora alkaliphila TaxID=622674 RepID=UPI003D230F0C